MTENSCRRCFRHLSNPVSMKHGYGPVCYRKRMNGDARQSKEMDPCTILDSNMAQKVYQAIYRLVKNSDENSHARGYCHVCKTSIDQMPIESMDHDAGMILPGFEKPQWFYLHDEHNDLAIWKIRITDKMILDEMEAVGDIPEGWLRK